MVRKVQKKALKPNTDVTKTLSKAKKEEELSNGYADNEGETALNTEDEAQERVENRVIEQEKAEEGISSENPKSVTKSRKRKTPAAPKEVKVKKKAVVTTKAKRQKVLLEIPKIKSVPGKVFVIGENDVGQLGFGEDITEKRRPALLELPHSIVDIAAGGMHSVCLTESGEVITFGCNDEGALGRITSEEGSEHIPRRVDIAERIVQVSAGDSHTAALSDSGQVYIWGNFRNGNGPMGLVRDGQKECLPVKILNDVTIVKIASGTEHLVCLSQEGNVYTCGCGEAGQLGRVSGNASVDGGRRGKMYLLTPDKVPVSRLSDIVHNIWTGSYSTFVHVQNQDCGLIYAFGLNNYNQLGFRNAGEQTMSLKPKKINSFNNKTWQQISGGQHHTLALDNNGLVHSLGRADYGRLGLGENSDVTSEPTEIPTLQDKNCVDISCGNCVSFAVADNGSAYSWGMGTSNQLGHGNDDDQDTPRQIEGNFVSSWKALKISGGGQHTLILATPREGSKESK